MGLAAGLGAGQVTPQRGVQRSAAFGLVDGLASEQRAQTLRGAQRFGQGKQGLKRLAVVALAGKIGVDRARAQGETGSATRIRRARRAAATTPTGCAPNATTPASRTSAAR